MGQTVYLIESGRVQVTVAAGGGPFCYNPTDNKVYCTDSPSGNVTVIDGAADTVITTVTSDSGPGALCYNLTDNKVYRANK